MKQNGLYRKIHSYNYWMYIQILKIAKILFPWGSKRRYFVKKMIQRIKINISILHKLVFSHKRKRIAGNETNGSRIYSSVSILFIGHDAQLAGAPVLLLSLIKWFAEHTGIQLKLILIQDGILLDKFKRIAPTLIWEDLINQFPDYAKRREVIAEFAGNINLIYGNTVLAPSIYDELAFLNAKYITHVHELEESIKLYIDEGAINKMHQYSDTYIACSAAVGLNIEINHNNDKKEIEIIESFIQTKDIQINMPLRQYRKKMGLIEDGLIVFGCGTMYWRKGIDLFIETAIKLKQKGFTNFHFYWIGINIWDLDPTSRRISTWKDLEHKIIVNGIKNNISFLGEKKNPTDYFISGDIFYLSSREEPFGLVGVEAAQFSIPVICFSDAGGMPVFVEKDAGFVVPFEDVNEVAKKIIYLGNNRDILNRLGETAKTKMLARHNIDIAAPQILRICQKVGQFRPVVSVIVPNYNYGKYLERRIESILNQTFRDFEIIILDDASTDNSNEIIEKYLKYPNVRFYKDIINSGNPFIQWHKGFLEAKGEFIWFAEADDYCDKNFLNTLLPGFNDSRVALAYCNSHMVDDTDQIIGDYNSYLDKLDPVHWKSSFQVSGRQEINFGLGVKNSIPNASAVVFRKNCITEEIFLETFKFKFSGDWFFYTQVIKGKDIYFRCENLNYHRKHSQTVTSKFNTEKLAIQLLLKEAELIHDNILENFAINVNYLKKWEFYLNEQILAFYPNTLKEQFDKFYPYNLIAEKIKKAIIKSETSKRLVFLTTNDGSPIGGSEELWRLAAIECKKRGQEVLLVVKKWNPEPFFIKELENIGIEIVYKEQDHFNHIQNFNPDLMVISLGDQDEGIDYYEKCKKYKIPYVIVNQLTKEPVYWPIRKDISEKVKKGYLGAQVVLFTGKNNHEVMQRRLNCTIPNAGICFNPFDVDRNINIPFPSIESGLKIAITARLLRIHKGQHLAIELFNQKKWRERPIHLNLYGEGQDEEVLKKQARDYKMTNVSFHGHTNDILAVWKENHAIMLPSFMEGLPLALVGAMICGRVPIVTDIGAHREVIDNNISGFIAAYPTVEALDDAMERAYQRFLEWEEIGGKAKEKILSIIPKDPIDDFISKIIPLTNKKQDYSL